MKPRRSTLELKLDLLSALYLHTQINPLKVTHLMRDANCSWEEAVKIGDELIKADLVGERASSPASESRAYFITQGGLEVVQLYAILKEKISPE